MPIVVSTWSGATTITRNQLVERVAALYGLDTADSEFVNRIVGWLDESINDLNYMTWESSKTVETGILLTEGSQSVLFSTPFYKESQAYLTHTSDGDSAPLPMLPWVTFKRMFSDTTTTGTPSVYSIFNSDLDFRIYFDVLPTADVAANYTLSLEYYRRIPKVSSLSGGQGLEIPTEFENVLLYGAFKRAAMHFGNQGEVAQYQALEREAYDRMKRADRMRPDADNRFRLVDETNGLTWSPGLQYPY